MYGSSSQIAGVSLFFMLVLLVCYIAAWVLAMGLVTKAAKEKGYYDMTGKLWFIGLFGLIVTPCVIVAALPDKKLQESVTRKDNAKADELPPI